MYRVFGQVCCVSKGVRCRNGNVLIRLEPGTSLLLTSYLAAQTTDHVIFFCCYLTFNCRWSGVATLDKHTLLTWGLASFRPVKLFKMPGLCWYLISIQCFKCQQINISLNITFNLVFTSWYVSICSNFEHRGLLWHCACFHGSVVAPFRLWSVITRLESGSIV